MNQKVILVDFEDRTLGVENKETAHSSPMLHRAFSIFLYHGDQLLIQKRALTKYHSGGLWANTCCSHPQPGESLTDAALKRLREEAGIKDAKLRNFSSFTYFYKFTDHLFEYEFDHVFIGDYQGRFSPEREEVEEIQWVSMDSLLVDMVRSPLKYAPWFLISAPGVIRYLLRNSSICGGGRIV